MPIARTHYPFVIRRLGPEDAFSEAIIPVTGGPNRYSLWWIAGGSGQLRLDSDELPLAAGHVYFIKPGQRVTYTLTGPVQGLLLSFDRDFIDLFDGGASSLMRTMILNRFYLLPGICIPPALLPTLEQMAASMLEEYNSERPLRLEVIKSLLNVFIIYLLRNSDIALHPTDNSRPADLVAHFIRLVDAHYVEKKRVSEYASLLAISPNYLTMIVKQVSGISPGCHIRQRIVLEAKRQAMVERESLKQIAFALGFCDPAHFSRYFKHCTGVSFTQFKRTA